MKVTIKGWSVVKKDGILKKDKSDSLAIFEGEPHFELPQLYELLGMQIVKCTVTYTYANKSKSGEK